MYDDLSSIFISGITFEFWVWVLGILSFVKKSGKKGNNLEFLGF